MVSKVIVAAAVVAIVDVADGGDGDAYNVIVVIDDLLSVLILVVVHF